MWSLGVAFTTRSTDNELWVIGYESQKMNSDYLCGIVPCMPLLPWCFCKEHLDFDEGITYLTLIRFAGCYVNNLVTLVGCFVFVFLNYMFSTSYYGKQQLKHLAALCIKHIFIGPERANFVPCSIIISKQYLNCTETIKLQHTVKVQRDILQGNSMIDLK